MSPEVIEQFASYALIVGLGAVAVAFVAFAYWLGHLRLPPDKADLNR
jgi:hypothetical protein